VAWRYDILSPEGAEYLKLFFPLRCKGSKLCFGVKPKALPWARLSRPFGAKIRQKPDKFRQQADLFRQVTDKFRR